MPPDSGPSDPGDPAADLGLTVVEVPDARRFEIHTADGTRVGLADYQRTGDLLAFTHTEVSPELRGRGIASVLMRGAMDEVRTSGRQVVAYCPYVRTWLERHPDCADLVADPS